MNGQNRTYCSELLDADLALRNTRCSYPPFAYVCCGAEHNIAVVDMVKGVKALDIPCGEDAEPDFIAVAPAQNCAYIADRSGPSVLKLDLCCNMIMERAAVPGTPEGLDVSADGTKLYVVFDDLPMMQVLDTVTLECLWQMALPSPAAAVAVPQPGERAFVTLPPLNQTAVVDLCGRSVIALLETGLVPAAMAASDTEPLILVAGQESRTLIPIDTETLTAGEEISLPGTPAGLAFTNVPRRVLVALPSLNEACVVDMAAEEIFGIAVGAYPQGAAASRIFPLGVVCNQGSSSVSVLNTDALAVTATVLVGAGPTGAAVAD